MYIKLTDGDELECIGVYANSVTYQGVNRDCLTFLFDPETTVETLLEKFTEENCSTVKIIDDGGDNDGNPEEFVHENYTVRIGAGVSCKDPALNNMTGSAVRDTQPVSWVSMAQTTLTERTLMSQQEAIDALIVTSLEG